MSSIAGMLRSASRSDSREVLGAVDVLDAHQPDEVRVRLVVVEGQLGQPADRGDRVEVLDVDLRSASRMPAYARSSTAM